MAEEPLGDVLDDSDGRRVGAGSKVTLTLRVRRYNPDVRADSWWY